MCPDYVSNKDKIETMELTEFYPPLGMELAYSFLFFSYHQIVVLTQEGSRNIIDLIVEVIADCIGVQFLYLR